MFLFDAITPFERVRVCGALSSKITELQTGLAPLARVKVSADVLGLLARLGEAEQAPADDGLSDDPNAPNYRYRDTGYIADSRKELAQNLIRLAKEDGRQVLATDLDWEEVERNPRAAAELITKSNLFGATDWDALKAAGMTPGAGFLIDRVYASIATQPAESTPRARQDYAIALKTIRIRLEGCKEPQEVTDVIGGIREELEGSQLNAEESAHYQAVQAQYDALREKYIALEKERTALANAATIASRAVDNYGWEQNKRTRRGWKPDPELAAKIAELTPAREAAIKAVADWEAAHPEYADQWVTTRHDDGSSESSRSGGLRSEMTDLRRQQTAIEKSARIRNITESPVTRGWLTFGERFFKVLNYRHYSKGSDAFAGHVANAKNGRIPDWGWAEKERVVVKKATKQEIGFQLKVAENFQRIGGTPVKVDSTLALKNMLGFRDVQSGNWVLKDPASAKFHVEQTAGAMLDLGDVLGIEPKALGLGGRLGMAFGARGTGSAGWASGAAMAHYESVHRVINLTKMGGGGALGHEWFHAIDDTLAELASGESTGTRNFASVNSGVLPDGPLRVSMAALNSVMMSGSVRTPEIIKIGPDDRRLALHNIDTSRPTEIARQIKACGELTAAVIAVSDYFKGRTDKRSIKNEKQWKALAAAYYSPEGETFARAKSGPAGSSFFAEAVRLDQGQRDKYWSKRHEMAARAFQSYLEDRLEGQGRRNDYLSSFADNKYHYDALLGIQWNPYPEGEERTRINAAFDSMFAAIRDERVFERAMDNKPLLDAIFGASSDPQEELLGILASLRQASPDVERVSMAQRLVELIPQVTFDTQEAEDAAIAAAVSILEDAGQ